MRDFTVIRYEGLRIGFETTMGGWVEQGSVKSVHTILDRFEQVPAAVESLLSYACTGQVIVSVDG